MQLPMKQLKHSCKHSIGKDKTNAGRAQWWMPLNPERGKQRQMNHCK